MATATWKVEGQYYETCSCDFVCPCVPGQLTVSPSKGSCTFAMAFQINRGSYGNVSLDGLGFIIVGLTPEAMGKGPSCCGSLRACPCIEEPRARARPRVGRREWQK